MNHLFFISVDNFIQLQEVGGGRKKKKRAPNLIGGTLL